MYTPTAHITERMCMDAVSRRGSELQYVPSKFISVEMCLAAVRSDGDCLRYIPKEYRTKEIMVEALKNSLYAFRSVDVEKELTPEICMELVRHDGLLMRMIPKKLHTEEMETIALDNNPEAIAFVDQNEEKCMSAVKRSSRSIRYVKRNFMSRKMFDDLIPFIGYERYIPEEMMDEELESRIRQYYLDQDYEIFGPYKIYMKICKKTHPCKHQIIMEDGSVTMKNARAIYKLLAEHGLSHPHFDRYGPDALIDEWSDSSPVVVVSLKAMEQ